MRMMGRLSWLFVFMLLACQSGADGPAVAGAGAGGTGEQPQAGMDAVSSGGSSAGSGGTVATGGSSGEVDAGADAGEAASVPSPVGELSLSLPSDDQAELDALESKLAELEDLTASELLASHPIAYAELGYDPSQAQGLDLIQASELGLNAQETDKLAEQGFVIVPRVAFPNMADGYRAIYAHDLPVYISVDAILDALHLSYDKVLQDVEANLLAQELSSMLHEARSSLAAGAVADEQAAADIDLYLAVALNLLEDDYVAPVAGADADKIQELTGRATSGDTGIAGFQLFGVPREIDFSQFNPRGHYTDNPRLQGYFRAMMWLGRIDFRLIEAFGDGSQRFHRRQLASVLALRDVMAGPARDAHARIDEVVTAFIGEHDYMQLAEVDALLGDLGVSTTAEALELDDATLASAIIAGGYGAQRIASQVIVKTTADTGTLPLGRSFALMGQRFVVDSHVLSNVVFDRVPRSAAGIRHLPDPLDVAYAALGNPAGLPLLEPGLAQHGYAPQLERVRVLTDAHADDYWEENLYNLWLSALRALSPSEGMQEPAKQGMPLVTGTEPWSRRMLNTQLASWAELRHDTVLYAKQSYGTGYTCEFPDAYVDPYPEMFDRIARFGTYGGEIVEILVNSSTVDLFVESLRTYFRDLESIARILEEMAEYQRAGMPFSDVHMEFINDAVVEGSGGCGKGPTYRGWYGRLLYNRTSEEMDPTIADVHTFPGPEPPAAILHVATGVPRLMVVTANTCEGPRAYAGVAFAYHEVVTGLERLTDDEWVKQLPEAEDVEWMKPILP